MMSILPLICVVPHRCRPTVSSPRHARRRETGVVVLAAIATTIAIAISCSLLPSPAFSAIASSVSEHSLLSSPSASLSKPAGANEQLTDDSALQRYLAILQAYRDGKSGALDRLREFSNDDLETFNGNWLILLNRAFSPVEHPDWGPVALVMHCDLALRAALNGWQATQASQLAILERLANLAVLRTGDRAVRARRGYHLLSVWLAVTAGDLPLVEARLRRGQAAFPDDPDLLLAEASHADFFTNPSVALPEQLTGADEVLTPLLAGMQRSRLLILASQKYSRVVDLRPPPITVLDARVRLARLHILSGRRDAAAQELAAVFDLVSRLGSAERQQVRRIEHLAFMFSARLAESAADWPEAIRAYRQAGVLCPLSQAAPIGLSYAQVMNGNEAEARRLTRTLLQREALPSATSAAAARRPIAPDLCAGDPWTSYPVGQAWRIELLIAELRAMVRS